MYGQIVGLPARHTVCCQKEYLFAKWLMRTSTMLLVIRKVCSNDLSGKWGMGPIQLSWTHLRALLWSYLICFGMFDISTLWSLPLFDLFPDSAWMPFSWITWRTISSATSLGISNSSGDVTVSMVAAAATTWKKAENTTKKQDWSNILLNIVHETWSREEHHDDENRECLKWAGCRKIIKRAMLNKHHAGTKWAGLSNI